MVLVELLEVTGEVVCLGIGYPHHLLPLVHGLRVLLQRLLLDTVRYPHGDNGLRRCEEAERDIAPVFLVVPVIVQRVRSWRDVDVYKDHTELILTAQDIFLPVNLLLYHQVRRTPAAAALNGGGDDVPRKRLSFGNHRSHELMCFQLLIGELIVEAVTLYHHVNLSTVRQVMCDMELLGML